MIWKPRNSCWSRSLESNVLASTSARKEVVDTVSDVLENELQCSICNELFITVSICF